MAAAFPIDPDAHIRTVNFFPKLDNKTKEQRKDQDGVPVWSIEALYQAAVGVRSELILVTYASHTEPKISRSTGFADLTCKYYSMVSDRGGTNSGLSFNASSLVDFED